MTITGAARSRPYQVLLIEDSRADVLMTRKSLEQGTIPLELHVTHDGVEAMKFVRRVPPYHSAPVPDLILLDLNLPRKDGREVLSEIKTDEELKSIPVIVLTTSQAEEDRVRSYKLHANCYVTKPVDFESFSGTMREIERFWLEVVSLPT